MSKNECCEQEATLSEAEHKINTLKAFTSSRLAEQFQKVMEEDLAEIEYRNQRVEICKETLAKLRA